jgi:CheY-like chemotaxis protein
MVLGTRRDFSKQKTILIIEDEDAIIQILREELSALGYRVAIASNGQDGLQKIQDVEPDLIICDRMMPGMSGSQMLERLRGIYPQYGEVPFIFLTALTDAQDKDQIAELKPFAYLEKPLDFNRLKATIQKALG